MAEAEELTCSQKRYLFAIYQLYLQQGTVTITALAQAVGVSKSSTTCMTGKLSERGFLRKAYYGEIELTENGLNIAKSIYNQVQVLRSFFTEQLLVDAKQAQTDAVAFVVYSSGLTMNKFTDFLQKRNTYSEAG